MKRQELLEAEAGTKEKKGKQRRGGGLAIPIQHRFGGAIHVYMSSSNNLAMIH